MSQMPPPGPPAGYPNYPPQGPGMPGMPGGGYSLPPTSRTSAAAVCSLIFGIIGCFPFVSSIVAVITGLVGLSATSSPAVKGRGMAITGIFLGILWFVGWSGLVGWVHYEATHMVNSADEMKLARVYVQDLADANIDDAVSKSVTTGTMNKAMITSLSDQTKPWGTFVDAKDADMQIGGFSFFGKYFGGGTASANFTNGAHYFTVVFLKESGEVKVATFKWDN